MDPRLNDLQTWLEDLDEEDAAHLPNTTSTTTNTGESSTRPITPQPSPSRSVWRSLNPWRSSQRRLSDSTLNPQASDFRPAASMRSKRKASSPTEQAGQSNTKVPAFLREVPVIKTSDIFATSGTMATPTLVPASSDRVSEGSDDDSDVFELTAPISLQHINGPPVTADQRRRMRVQLARRQGITSRTYVPESSSKTSAVLISDQPTMAAGHVTASIDTERFHYLPLGPLRPGSTRSRVEDHSQLTVLPSHRERMLQLDQDTAPSNATWPLHQLPVELFELITSYLARDDVKSMRVVSREFEQKVSRSLFYTSVVPFNTELYDMIDEDKRIPTAGSGKEKARLNVLGGVNPLCLVDAPSLQWQNAREDKDGKVYKGHGLRVFRGFGPHIKRFGMSFEVSERQLSQPLAKKELDHIQTYFGSYDWPSQYYTRFANLAGLENTADETSKMKAAFSNLEIVQELGLSIDSGLGWLNGPDKSVRARLFERQSPVFGRTSNVPDRATQAAADFWAAIQQSRVAFDPNCSSLAEIDFEGRKLISPPDTLPGLRGKIYGELERWPVMQGISVRSRHRLPQIPTSGVVYTTNRWPDLVEFEGNTSLPLLPNALKREQKEWLLETQWAQQAFFESYMLAVIDNPTNFGKVTTLNIAKLSSRFLGMLSRPYFWNALPCLSDVTLRVSADWRNVDKDDAGQVVVKSEWPSHALRMFHKDILRDHISARESIKALTIGWVGGGEHAEGIHARNLNLLPAPITQLEHTTANSGVFGLVFQHVEHLTLSNCWITPPTLEGLVKSHASHALKTLTLDSVSLTAHPRYPANANAGLANPMQQAIAGLPHAQLQQPAQGAGFPVPPAFNVGQHAGGVQQNWQAHLQQMQQLFQGNQNVQIAQMQQAQQVAAQTGNNANLPQGVMNPNLMLQQMQHAQQLAAQAGNNANLPPGMPAPAQAAQAQQAIPPPPAAQMPVANSFSAPIGWTDGHREGSWPDVLDSISPGPNFDDYRPAPPAWEEQPPPRSETSLKTIELISCGYARLARNTTFDQSAIVNDQGGYSMWFARRSVALKQVMMEAKDRYQGQIIQHIPQRELDAMQFAWGLTEGWADTAKAEESIYDGNQPGGTGRVSGTITKGMALVGEPAEEEDS